MLAERSRKGRSVQILSTVAKFQMERSISGAETFWSPVYKLALACSPLSLLWSYL